MNKDTFAVIQEIKHHRNGFMKKSTPYRQLTRAIKQLEKLERIEQIVSDYGLINVNLLSDDLTDFEKDILREILEEEITKAHLS